MRITEFHKPLTAQALNESAEKTFGQKINLESFSMEQLEDARNKLRTKLYQFENTEGFNAVHENDSYAKNKMFLDVLNQAIIEREESINESSFTAMEQLVLDKVEEGIIDFESLPEELQAKVRQVHENQSADDEMLAEGEEEKAEFIMSARDMADRITGWMEDTANMQAENMLKFETGMEPTDDFDTEPTDEFGAAAPAAGGDEVAGRAKRESIDYSRRLASILAPKKK